MNEISKVADEIMTKSAVFSETYAEITDELRKLFDQYIKEVSSNKQNKDLLWADFFKTPRVQEMLRMKIGL